MTTQYRTSSFPHKKAAQSVTSNATLHGQVSRESLPTSSMPEDQTCPNATANLALTEPAADVDYDYVHYIIIGSPSGVEDAIKRLHLGDRIERHRWTPFIRIREEGLRITPREGQVLSYLIRQRLKE